MSKPTTHMAAWGITIATPSGNLRNEPGPLAERITDLVAQHASQQLAQQGGAA